MSNTLMLRCSVAIAAISMSVPAFAQEPAESSSPSEGLEEIVVTAQRREERIVLPGPVMDRYGLKAGEAVYCQALPEGLMILSQDAALAHVTRMAREKMPEQAALIEALLKGRSST